MRQPLVCGRHHTEVHLEEWEIRMRDGIPWVVAPSWIDRSRRLLRNAAHHPDNYRLAAREPWKAKAALPAGSVGAGALALRRPGR